MRRAALTALLTCAALAVLAGPASAFDHHFTVVSKTISDHRTKHAFVFSERLLSPRNLDNSVGRDRGRCVEPPRNRGKVHCRVTVHLTGDIGGTGRLSLNGNLNRHDNTLYVVGGGGGFNGAAGKVTLRRGNRLHFDLTR
jgi:hypothetical protein